MQSDLYDAFREACLAAPPAQGALRAAAITGRPRDYVSVGTGQEPVLLLSCPPTLLRAPIRLQHLSVEFGVRFRVQAASAIVEDDFVVVSLRGEDLGLAELFCLAGDALVAALPASPSATDIERVVRQFVDLLSELTLPSSRTVAGLWAELWLMCTARDRRAAVEAWHGEATDRFDFAFASHFVEVKATESEQRIHEFSHEQLRSSALPLTIASLKLRRAQSGRAIADLIADLQAGLTPHLRTKIVRNVFSAVGIAVSESSEMRFDEAYAEANLRVIASERVPVVVIPAGSPISAVRYKVNLDDSSLSTSLRKPSTHAALAPTGSTA